MKAKQLPGSLDRVAQNPNGRHRRGELAQAQFENRPARRANDNERTPKPSSIAKTLRTLTWIKLVRFSNPSCDAQAALRGQRVNDVSVGCSMCPGRGSRQLSDY